MAAIDKTYVDNWKDYSEIVEWCENNSFVCPNGAIIKFYPYDWDEEDFKDGKEHSVLNTSYTQDYFLIKFCPLEVIQNRMKEVYDEEYYQSVLNGTSDYDKFVRPPKVNKIKLVKKPDYYKPDKWFNDYTKRWIRDKYSVDIEIPEEWGKYPWYNEEIDQWLMPNELGKWTISSPILKIKSWKALIRKIRSWYLPKGTIIKVSHFKWSGGECEFIVK